MQKNICGLEVTFEEKDGEIKYTYRVDSLFPKENKTYGDILEGVTMGKAIKIAEQTIADNIEALKEI